MKTINTNKTQSVNEVFNNFFPVPSVKIKSVIHDDTNEIDLVTHDFIADESKRKEFLDAFDQDDFEHLAKALLDNCLHSYNSLPAGPAQMVYNMAEMMAKKSLGYTNVKASDYAAF